MILGILGFLILIAALAMLIIRPSLKEERVKKGDNRYGEAVYEEPAHPLLLWFNKQKSIALIVLALVLMFQSQFWFYAKSGHQYFIVTPLGSKNAEFNPGIKFVMPFSRIQEWSKYIDIKTISQGEPTDGVEGIIAGGIPIRFIDQVTATVEISARMELPSDEVSFIKLADEFRDPSNLINNTLIPTVREQVINTGYMYAAQDYISGSAADFRQTLDEQLKDGGFSVEKKELYDTTYLNVDIQSSKSRQIKEVVTKYEVTKRVDKHGKPIRTLHDITKNKIYVSQVIVDQVELEQAFKDRLEKQRDISAQKRIEIESIETAKAAQQRILAEGERDKAKERVEQEKEQVKVLIAVETQKKQEVTKKELAEIAYETAMLEAKALRVRKDAEAYANRALVNAGLTPQEKAQIWKETQIGVAQAIAGPQGLNMPSFYMSGGDTKGNGQGDPLQQILTMMLAQQTMNNVGNVDKGGK